MSDFSFLPKSGIIFIDNCVFGTNLEPKFSMDQLTDDQERFRNLQEALSTRDNWLVIPEIIEEFYKSNAYLHAINIDIIKSSIFGNLNDRFSSKEIKKIVRKNRKKRNIHNATKDYLLERRAFSTRFLQEEFRNATENLIKEQYKRREELLPLVESIFLNNGGVLNELNTDCKLIATALIYAETTKPSRDNYVYIFSYDKPLLSTFTEATRTLGLTLENTYVINKKHYVASSHKYSN